MSWSYQAHDGEVWRNGAGEPSTVDAYTAERLLARFQREAADTSDYFHKRAGVLAEELQAAMAEAETQRHGRKAA